MALVINTELEGPRDVHLIVTGTEENYTDAIVYQISGASDNAPGKTLETVGIVSVTYSINGTEYDTCTLSWDDSSSDPKALELKGEGYYDFSDFGAFYPSNIVSGTDNGDLLLTTPDPTVGAGDNYLTLHLHLRKRYV